MLEDFRLDKAADALYFEAGKLDDSGRRLQSRFEQAVMNALAESCSRACAV